MQPDTIPFGGGSQPSAPQTLPFGTGAAPTKQTGTVDTSMAALSHSQSMLNSSLDGAKNLAIGVTKDAIHTAQGANELGGKVADSIMGPVGQLLGQGNKMTSNSLDQQNATDMNALSHPEGTAQKIGYTAAEIGQYFTPAGMEKGVATHAAPLLEGIPKAMGMAGKIASGVGGALKMGLKSLTSAASMGGVSAVQSGGDPEAIKTNAEIGAASPFAAMGLSGLSQLAQKLPTRLTMNALPKLNPNNIDKVLNDTKIGSIDSLKNEATQNMNSLSSHINSILQSEPYAKHYGNSNQSILDTVAAYPHSDYSPKEVVSAIKGVVPGFTKLVTKLENGFATLPEKNQLREALDAATAKVFTDSPQVTASKDIAATLASALRNEVKSIAPETEGAFAELSKEINLKNALTATAKKMSKKNPINLFSLLSFMGGAGKGFMAGGPIGALAGGVGAAAAEELARSPGTAINTAKAINAAGALPNPAGLGAKYLGSGANQTGNEADNETNQ